MGQRPVYALAFGLLAVLALWAITATSKQTPERVFVVIVLTPWLIGVFLSVVGPPEPYTPSITEVVLLVVAVAILVLGSVTQSNRSAALDRLDSGVLHVMWAVMTVLALGAALQLIHETYGSWRFWNLGMAAYQARIAIIEGRTAPSSLFSHLAMLYVVGAILGGVITARSSKALLCKVMYVGVSLAPAIVYDIASGGRTNTLFAVIFGGVAYVLALQRETRVRKVGWTNIVLGTVVMAGVLSYVGHVLSVRFEGVPAASRVAAETMSYEEYASGSAVSFLEVASSTPKYSGGRFVFEVPYNYYEKLVGRNAEVVSNYYSFVEPFANDPMFRDNTYTMFYEPWLDGGWMGVMVFSAVVAGLIRLALRRYHSRPNLTMLFVVAYLFGIMAMGFREWPLNSDLLWFAGIVGLAICAIVDFAMGRRATRTRREWRPQAVRAGAKASAKVTAEL